MIPHTNKIIRLPAVQEALAVGRTSIYQALGEGLITKPIKVSARLNAWPESEIEAIKSARIAGQSNEQIKSLVIELQTRRGR